MTTRLNHLLVATDLSAPARRAAERAALLSQETGAPLELLHVANLAPLERLRLLMMESPEALQQRVLERARQKLCDLGAALLTRYGISPGVRAVAGDLLAELAMEADVRLSDLIVCGARGESFMRHILLGSTAERMLGKTKCPMLVVKQVAHEPYRTVLVPVDFSPSSLVAIRSARLLAPRAEIVLLHAFEVPFEGHLRYASVDADTIRHYRVVARKEAVEKAHALARQAGLPPHSVRYVVLHGNPASCILAQEQEQNCDLLVMGKHGESALEDLLIGSVTKRILAESQCDVLISV
jgi:nucleotide-binding universal stress UspA family protein